MHYPVQGACTLLSCTAREALGLPVYKMYVAPCFGGCCTSAVCGCVSLGLHSYWRVSHSTVHVLCPQDDIRGGRRGPVRAGGREATHDMASGYGLPPDDDYSGSDRLASPATATTDPVTGSGVRRQTATISAVVAPRPPHIAALTIPRLGASLYLQHERRSSYLTRSRYHAYTAWARPSSPRMAPGHAHLPQARRPASNDTSAAIRGRKRHVACIPAGGCLSRQSSSSIYRSHM